ncbi:MAG: DAK2 domain-containing protein [Clostridia bacterium]|nr:DAK2 domain-containing protein [Clostridia bacterium]MBR0357122.1 DAK2 domain-containing protein [Clostridia bacterium]
MITDTIDGALLRDMFLAGASLLEKNRALVDSLNVFPVPDGDTGTNMSMTMQGAVKDLKNLPETATVEEVMAKVSSGALRSARGNSGVILSQLFRGFYKVAKGHEELDGATFAAAMMEGTTAAYKAVMKPKEGTILTVSRMISDEVKRAVEEDPLVGCMPLMILSIQKGEEALKMTPDLLPVLKEAGVVDSGGKGLMFIYHGFLMAMNGEVVLNELPVEEKPEEKELSETANFSEFSAEDIQFGYCTEFFIVHLYDGFEEKDLDQFRKHLERVGDSVVCACDSDTVKIHVHSNCPGKVLQMAMRYGELDRIKIENMREQNRQLAAQRKRTEKEFALISVSCGAGVDEVFKALSTDHIISGGQTMNPSIDSIVNAVHQVNARNVFVLPNNSNIILAANQASVLCNCHVVVLPTKTIPQGIAAAMAFNPDESLETNVSNMTEAFQEVVSGSVTFAVRETQVNGKAIHEGDFIGMLDGDLNTVDPDADEAAFELVQNMIEKLGDEECSVTVYYGADVEEGRADALIERLEEKYPEAEFMSRNGGQPLYSYYFSVI